MVGSVGARALRTLVDAAFRDVEAAQSSEKTSVKKARGVDVLRPCSGEAVESTLPDKRTHKSAQTEQSPGSCVTAQSAGRGPSRSNSAASVTW